MSNESAPTIGSILKSQTDASSKVDPLAVNSKAEKYLRHFDPLKNQDQATTDRLLDSKAVTNMYYDLATDFYEYGYGDSFHFAVLRKGESREHSLAKYEYGIALKLELKPQENVLDVGCGIGGPARHIASFSGARVTGINFNDYQIQRARILTKADDLEHLCTFVEADFHNTDFSNDSFDKAYAIEATCHSFDLVKVYSEVFRVLKPGGLFVCCEWIMTEKYDKNDSYHRKLKADILEGDGLSDLATAEEADAAAKAAGFEIISTTDHALLSPVPWYTVLQAKWALSDLKITPLGRWLTHVMLLALETCRMAPQGSVKVHRILCKGADALVAAGIEGIFTPMYAMVLKKPS